ncbi:MAG: hypothetical protein J6P03_06130 [Opitutales bacterium]|nr:hypothetical protein [Opitutales bacterium]
MKKFILSAVLSLISCAQVFAEDSTLNKQPYADWARFNRYEKENAKLFESGAKPVAVFMGDSIIDMWSNVIHKEFFKENNYLGRALCGQTTIQMIARFYKDVLAFKPKVVVIMGGTNDIAENEGYTEPDDIANNIFMMAELARANGAVPVICSITPAAQYRWRTRIKDVPAKIETVNNTLKDYCKKNGVIYLDYFSKLANAEKGLDPDLSGDGVHPNLKCYKIMEPLTKEAVDKALKRYKPKK